MADLEVDGFVEAMFVSRQKRDKYLKSIIMPSEINPLIHLPMFIDTELLDKLTAQAQSSPCLRMRCDLQDSEEDQSLRMLKAIVPGTVIPVHRHTMTSEDIVMLRGRADGVIFDADGNETVRFILIPGGESPEEFLRA